MSDTNIVIKSSKGQFYTVFSQIIIAGMQLLSQVWLARLLEPDDFGVVATSLVFANFARLFQDLGISQAVIQRKSISQNELSTLFWVNIIISLILLIVLSISAPFLSEFYGNKSITDIIIIVASSFIFSGASVQHRSLLRRELDFIKLAFINTVSKLITVICAIAFALYFRSYWALIILNIGDCIIQLPMFWIACRWIPDFKFSFKEAKSSLLFGVNVSGYNILNFLSQNIDKIIIGRIAGVTQLGFYERGYRLAKQPVDQIRLPLFSVLLPTLSKLQTDKEAFRSYFLKEYRNLGVIISPIGTITALYASEIVNVVLGNKWPDSIIYFRIFGIIQAIESVMSIPDQIPLATGKSNLYLFLGGIKASMNILCLIIGSIFGGAIGAANAYLMSSFILFFPYNYLCIYKSSIHYFDILKVLSVIIISQFLYVIISYIVHLLFNNELIVLIIGVILSLFLYFIIVIKINFFKHIFNR